MCLRGLCRRSVLPALGSRQQGQTFSLEGGQDVAGAGEIPRRPTPQGRDGTCAGRPASGDKALGSPNFPTPT